jgi:hypothetical protein
MSAILLDKNNFILLENGQFKINHPAFYGTEGFIIFYSSWCRHCQDTKIVWSSIGYIDKPFQQPQIPSYIQNQMISRDSSIKRHPMLKVVTANGNIINYNGGQKRKNTIISKICNLANLNCN